MDKVYDSGTDILCNHACDMALSSDKNHPDIISERWDREL